MVRLAKNFKVTCGMRGEWTTQCGHIGGSGGLGIYMLKQCQISGGGQSIRVADWQNLTPYYCFYVAIAQIAKAVYLGPEPFTFVLLLNIFCNSRTRTYDKISRMQDLVCLLRSFGALATDDTRDSQNTSTEGRTKCQADFLSVLHSKFNFCRI